MYMGTFNKENQNTHTHTHNTKARTSIRVKIKLINESVHDFVVVNPTFETQKSTMKHQNTKRHVQPIQGQHFPYDKN
jgi:hypothetical protein